MNRTKDELLRELSKVIGDNERKTLQSKITDYYKARINEQMFFDSWIEVLGKRLVVYFLAVFIINRHSKHSPSLLLPVKMKLHARY